MSKLCQDCSNDDPREWDTMIPTYAFSSKLSALIAFFVAVIIYTNSVDGKFVFDDSEAVVNNQDIQPESPLRNLLFNDFWGTPLTHNRSHKSYRPITVLTFRWNFLMAKEMDPFGFHLINILLHGLVSALAVPVAHKLLGGHAHRMSFLTALLFAVHPIHTEAVAGIVGRADLLCAFFSFLSFLAYVKAAETALTSNLMRSAFFLISFFLLCSLALLSKEQGITVIGICLVYDLLIFHKVNFNCFPWFAAKMYSVLHAEKSGQTSKLFLDHSSTIQRSKSTSCYDKILKTLKNRPFVIRLSVLILTGMLLLFARWHVMGFKPPVFQEVDNPASFAPYVWTRVRSYIYIYSLNVWLLLCPEWLSFDWSMGCVPLISHWYDRRLLAVGVFLASLIGFLWRGITSTGSYSERAVNAAFAVMIIPFLPASNIFFRVGFVLAERVLFLPSLGFCILVVLGLRNVLLLRPQLKWITMCAFYCLLILFSVRCVQRNSEWLDEKRLFRSALAICPLNAKVHYNVAKNAGDMGDKELALKEYKVALKLHPQYDQAMNNMANILRDEGKLAEAESLLREALTIRPDFAAAWMNLGIVLAGMNRSEEAHLCYVTALSHRPHYPECLYNLGNLYLGLKKHKKALEAFQKAVKQRPKFSIAWNNMVILLESTGNFMDAKSLAQEALSILPDDPGLHFNLANTLGKMSLFSDAEKHFTNAIKLAPHNAIYHSNMGVLYHRWKKYDLAGAKYRDALTIDPHMKSAVKNLAMLKNV